MLTQKRLKELFGYHDGDLIRRPGFMTRGRANMIAGFISGHGHVQTSIDGKLYLNHRLVWLWHNGYFPEHGLDHIDQDKTNNRIENLREASQSCNLRNTGNSASNTSGVKGVTWDKNAGKWASRVVLNRERIHLGIYADFLEAVCHRLAAEQAEDWANCGSSSPAYQYVKKHIPTIK